MFPAKQKAAWYEPVLFATNLEREKKTHLAPLSYANVIQAFIRNVS